MVEAAKPPKRILVVEDEAAIREEVAEMLEDQGHKVHRLANGQEALDLLKDGEVPDLIVLDLRMPVMDGWQFRVKQKSDPRLAGIPVIAISADAGAQAAAIDADYFLRKPFPGKAMRDTVELVLKISERERLRALNMGQLDRLASLGQLVAGVAHEVNNPLSFVTSNLAVLDEGLAEVTGHLPVAVLGPLREAVAEAKHGADRIRDIVRDLRVFSRSDEEEGPGACDLCQVLDTAINLAQHEVRHRANVVRDYEIVPLVAGTEARLGQVFLNLLINAAHSIPMGQADQNEIRLVVRMDTPGKVLVEVRDTGAGILPENLGKLFDPFFTTKPVGLGTGLGLSICHGIVSALGGEIEVESAVGRGTTLRVTLQVAVNLPTIAAPIDADISTARGCILVVDDEPYVGSGLRRALSKEHEVKLLTGGRAVLAALNEGERFDLILCDLMMPVMTGMELHAELANNFPDQAQRVVFMTGATFSPSVRDFLSSVGLPHMAKPVQLDTLRVMIRAVLTGGSE